MFGKRRLAWLAGLSVMVLASGASAQTLREYEDQWDLKMIGVQAAYDRGYTGKDVLVGVLDSGVNPTHRDLVGNLTPYSLDIYTGGPVTADPHGHGTHVAGTIAGTRDGVGLQGVAYDARLVILRLLDAGNVASGPDDAVADLLNYGLDHGVRIFNNSWGGLYLDPEASPGDVVGLYGPDVMAAYQRAVDLDAIMVWATGNESLDQVGLQAALPYYFPSWRGNWLAVTAVDSSGAIASYANHCGLAAQWCLAAPGGELPRPGESIYDALIWSSANDSDNGASGLAGTSMAAPHVTGAVAIARQMFPGAPAVAITRLVLTTATDLGPDGVDEVYGWGLLNVGNLAVTLDPQAGSVFANGAWAADAGQRPLHEALDDRLAGGSGPGVWGALLAGRAGHDATGSGLASDATTYGSAIGYDREVASGLLLGLSIAETRTTAKEARGANEAIVRTVGASVYARARAGRYFVEGSAGADAREYRFERADILGAAGTVLAGQGLTGRGSTDGVGGFVRARLGADFAVGAVTVRPFVHARASKQRIEAFEERGADVFSQTFESIDLTVYEAGPGVEAALPPRPMGKAEIGGAVSLRYDQRWGDDDFRTPTTLLGSTVPAAVGELDDAVTLAARVNARLGGGWDMGARGWWSQGGDHDAGGLAVGLRLSF